MSRDLTPAYADAQAFKGGGVDAEILESLRRAIALQLAKASLAEMGPALAHHYEHNSHHPERYKAGIAGMSLLDLIEMVCDWKAATERHDGDMRRSLALNAERFGISEQLAHVLANTVEEMAWA